MKIEIYNVFCSNNEFLNEDINEEVKKGGIPVTISCMQKEQGVDCCVVIKKHIERGETWMPEPKVWKR